MANASSICIILLPLIIALVGTRCSQAPPELEQQLSTLKTCLNNAQLEKEELEEEIEELSGSLTLAEAETRSLREHVGKLQDQLNDAWDLALANIPMQ
jgi:chromosome segregation ATPase